MTHDAIVLNGVVCKMDASWSGLDVSLHVEMGESLAIIGPSRSGKSVLIELCAGLVSAIVGASQKCWGLNGEACRPWINWSCGFGSGPCFNNLAYSAI